MEIESRHEKPFACDVCDHRFTTTRIMRRHKQAVHGDDVFKCSQPGCQFSTSSKTNLSSHLKGFHGTAGSFVCDNPGCTFRSTWRTSIANHKRQVHSEEKPLSCNYTACSYRAKTNAHLTRHKVHLNIRNKQCHVCEMAFNCKFNLKSHMATHEGDGHEMAKCEDCSASLRSKSSRETKPAAGIYFSCDHQGCDFKSRWQSSLCGHRKVHSEETPFICNYPDAHTAQRLRLT